MNGGYNFSSTQSRQPPTSAIVHSSSQPLHGNSFLLPPSPLTIPGSSVILRRFPKGSENNIDDSPRMDDDTLVVTPAPEKKSGGDCQDDNAVADISPESSSSYSRVLTPLTPTLAPTPQDESAPSPDATFVSLGDPTDTAAPNPTLEDDNTDEIISSPFSGLRDGDTLFLVSSDREVVSRSAPYAPSARPEDLSLMESRELEAKRFEAGEGAGIDDPLDIHELDNTALFDSGVSWTSTPKPAQRTPLACGREEQSVRRVSVDEHIRGASVINYEGFRQLNPIAASRMSTPYAPPRYKDEDLLRVRRRSTSSAAPPSNVDNDNDPLCSDSPHLRNDLKPQETDVRHRDLYSKLPYPVRPISGNSSKRPMIPRLRLGPPRLHIPRRPLALLPLPNTVDDPFRSASHRALGARLSTLRSDTEGEPGGQRHVHQGTVTKREIPASDSSRWTLVPRRCAMGVHAAPLVRMRVMQEDWVATRRAERASWEAQAVAREAALRGVLKELLEAKAKERREKAKESDLEREGEREERLDALKERDERARARAEREAERKAVEVARKKVWKGRLETGEAGVSTFVARQREPRGMEEARKVCEAEFIAAEERRKAREEKRRKRTENADVVVERSWSTRLAARRASTAASLKQYRRAGNPRNMI